MTSKLLVIEDNALNRDMLCRRLQREGFAVRFAVDGEAGVEMAEQLLPDLILMDIMLGDGIDGWEATRRIKARGATAHIPVIAVTAHADPSHLTTSHEAGCADYDTKPIDWTRLLGKIRACLGAQVAWPDPPKPPGLRLVV